VLERRKLVGSAQRRTASALLQQGSVLLGSGHLRLANYLRMDDRERAAIRTALAAASAEAGTWLAGGVALVRWAEALAQVVLPRPDRVEGAAGAFLLTPARRHSYTPRAS
jgi:hypothetical protein